MARNLTAVAAALIVVAGCASDPALLSSDVEAAIAESLLPVPVQEIRCGDISELDPATGGFFRCSGKVDGDEVEFEAVLAAALSDASIDVDVVLTTPLLDVAAVESEAADRLNAELGDGPVVMCEVPFVVIAAGRQLSCLVDRSSGPTRDITITVIDTDGNWEIDLLP